MSRADSKIGVEVHSQLDTKGKKHTGQLPVYFIKIMVIGDWFVYPYVNMKTCTKVLHKGRKVLVSEQLLKRFIELLNPC